MLLDLCSQRLATMFCTYFGELLAKIKKPDLFSWGTCNVFGALGRRLSGIVGCQKDEARC
jgi:hypothetical protein